MGPLFPIESIEPAHAANRFFSGKISLVDVRSNREYRAIRVPCAKHIPLPQFRRGVKKIRSDRPVALLCRSGRRSVLAARVARRRGLDAMSVPGGMHAWLAAGLPAVWPSEIVPRKSSISRATPAVPTFEAPAGREVGQQRSSAARCSDTFESRREVA